MHAAAQLPQQQPDAVGTLGKAWRMDLDRICATPAHRSAVICQWLIFAPYAHPAWHSYVLSCITLRDIDGMPPAKVNLPGGTHEAMLYALDPARAYALDAHLPLLHPANFCGQFIEPDDAAAAMRIEAVVRDVVDGRLNPDTDYMQWWIRRFSASNVKGDPATAGETRIVIDAVGSGQPAEIVIPPVPAPND